MSGPQANHMIGAHAKPAKTNWQNKGKNGKINTKNIEKYINQPQIVQPKPDITERLSARLYRLFSIC